MIQRYNGSMYGDEVVDFTVSCGRPCARGPCTVIMRLLRARCVYAICVFVRCPVMVLFLAKPTVVCVAKVNRFQSRDKVIFGLIWSLLAIDDGPTPYAPVRNGPLCNPASCVGLIVEVNNWYKDC